MVAKINVSSGNLLNQLCNIFFIKRLLSTKHHIKYSSRRPYINFFIIFIFCKNFRCWKGNSSCFCHHFENLGITFFLTADVEVQNVNLVVFRNKQILWLNITMCYVIFMQIIYTFHYLPKQMFRIFFSIFSIRLFCDVIQNFFALDEAHYLMNFASDFIIE